MPYQSKMDQMRQRQKEARQRVVSAKRFPQRKAVSNFRTGGFLGIEYKFLDQFGIYNVTNSITGAEIDPATNNCLNAVPQGDTESSRDGRKYTVTGIHVRGVLYRGNQNDQTEVGDANFVTLALVQDTQTNGAQAQSEDIFAIPTSGYPALPFMNLENSKRFKVLWKQTIVVPAGAPAYNGAADALETGGVAVPFAIDKKTRVIVNTSGTGATVGDITDNSFHLIAFADASAGASSANTITVKYNSRVRFVG